MKALTNTNDFCIKTDNDQDYIDDWNYLQEINRLGEYASI